MNDIKTFIKSLGCKHIDSPLYQEAFRHTTYINELKQHHKYNDEKDYQRLEYLGDALLQLVIAEILFQKYPSFNEGQLTVSRSVLVDNAQHAEMAKSLSLGNYMFLGTGDNVSGRANNSLLSQVYEALLGAIYLEEGYEFAKKLIIRLYKDKLEETTLTISNPKNRLQEVLKNVKPQYNELEKTGLDHAPIYTVEVLINNVRYGLGSASSKKQAEMAAATDALSKLEK